MPDENQTQELQAKINDATSRILFLTKERATREASALAHEQAAREDRLEMDDIKREIGELNTVLRHSQVAKNIGDAQHAARTAQGEAETAKKEAESAKREAEKTRDESNALLESLRAKEKQLDELLAKHSQVAVAAP